MTWKRDKKQVLWDIFCAQKGAVSKK